MAEATPSVQVAALQPDALTNTPQAQPDRRVGRLQREGVINSVNTNQPDLEGSPEVAKLVEVADVASDPLQLQCEQVKIYLIELRPEQVENYLCDLFEVADKNADGVVEPDELAQVLASSGFHLLDANIQRVLEATVSDWDGMINYRELLPVVTQLLRHMEQVQQKPMQYSQERVQLTPMQHGQAEKNVDADKVQLKPTQHGQAEKNVDAEKVQLKPTQHGQAEKNVDAEKIQLRSAEPVHRGVERCQVEQVQLRPMRATTKALVDSEGLQSRQAPAPPTSSTDHLSPQELLDLLPDHAASTIKADALMGRIGKIFGMNHRDLWNSDSIASSEIALFVRVCEVAQSMPANTTVMSLSRVVEQVCFDYLAETDPSGVVSLQSVRGNIEALKGLLELRGGLTAAAGMQVDAAQLSQPLSKDQFCKLKAQVLKKDLFAVHSVLPMLQSGDSEIELGHIVIDAPADKVMMLQEKLQQLFHLVDINQDGVLSVTEVNPVLVSIEHQLTRILLVCRWSNCVAVQTLQFCWDRFQQIRPVELRVKSML